MTRQHATPLLIAPDGASATPLTPMPMGSDGHLVSEATVQALVQAHPACLPIAEIDPLFVNPVPICTELNTPAGPIDNFLVTASGLPVLVECKLWRNPEARREVVGQILDYAKELSRWSSSDLQREVSSRLKRKGNAMLDLVRAAGHDIDEIAFNDALTLNLRRGRFLLLIVGDGIREGVEAIAEYLQAHAGLHFTLGLVELPIYRAPDGQRLIVPRILARTQMITREVVTLPPGLAVREVEAVDPDAEDRSLTGEEASRVAFMQEIVERFTLDDPDQPKPHVSAKGWLFLYLPAPASSCWISVLDRRSQRQVGVRLTANTGSLGEAAILRLLPDEAAIRDELGDAPIFDRMSETRLRIHEFLNVDRDASPAEREKAVLWLRRRINDYVTTFRPRIRDAVADLTES